ncbi:class I SAM-dependent methyltransferase [Ammoniphilus sp. 3BR4]|uniref:class I SAM-dependent methyltransferase n=1 Tax=Ammoniphilus sp. 3BR4 TaxID=3158265 RepID=UPI003466580F
MDLFLHKAADIAKFIQSAKQEGTSEHLLKYLADQSIQLFLEVNQYLDFNREDHRKLQELYGDLLERICILGNRENISESDLDGLFTLHYKNLQSFLIESNGTEIFKKYRENADLLKIKCTEYRPDFQMKLLNVRLQMIKQPVLDIGCGSKASLVHFLRENGIEAFGVDRNVDPKDYLFKMGWLECPFKNNTWGTVISHMAFSNHFIHHHLKSDGNVEMYASKYMEILHSLKMGGSFIYAPGLSFIEEVLISSNKSFVVETNEYSTHILRVR